MADLPLGANRKERSAFSCRTAGAHRALALDGFDSLPFFQNKTASRWDAVLFWSRVRESMADLPLGANRRERSASSCRTASARRALALDGFDSLPFFQKQNSIPMGCCFCFGAGYGNRTRLCGLGSDHSTDELTLHCRYYSRWGRKNQCLFCRHRISLLSLEKCSPLCYDRKKPSKGERLCFRKPF